MGLQPQGLVGHQGIGSTVGFVEAVAGKFIDLLEDMPGHAPIHVAFNRTVDEDVNVTFTSVSTDNVAITLNGGAIGGRVQVAGEPEAGGEPWCQM